ncbi:ATP-binding protein [Thermocatellispora tengchongensis]|uniref:ATP-binding protein n=1 Tax=Thermocatellispora tengchongensis TaxID=1073253 RepID=UPI00363BB12D
MRDAMRPLDFLGRIKIKLGLAVCLAVVVAFVVNEVGINAGLGRELRIAVAVALALLMVQLLGRGMIRPLREMAAAAQTIAKGRYGQRVRATSRDEVGELARAFNAMAADLGEVDRQRRELVANVSHELRTPITALRAVLENVVDGVSEPDVHTLGIALAQTERLGRLVAQLLDLSRLDSGAMHIDPETVGLEPLLDQAAREAALTRDDVTVRVAVRPAGLSVHADPGLLAQVLANLLDNAVRHSPPGGTVTLSAVPAPPSPASPGVQIAVADQGPGIPQAERTRVFERFSRLDAARAADAGGTGLGLAIVKEIVELHGGSIHIDDSPGCRMVVGLPGRITMGDSPTPEPPPSPTARPLAAPVPRKTTATTENAAGTEGAAREPAPTEPVPATTAPPSPAIAMAEAALPPAPDADATAPEMPATPAVAQGVAGSGVTEIVVAHGAPGSGVPEAVGSGVTQAPGPMTPVPGAGTEVQEPAVVPATGSGAKEVVVARLGSNVPEATAPPVGVTEAVGGLAVPEGAGVPVAAMGAVGSGVSEAVAPPTGATRAQEGAGIAAAEAGVPVTAAVAEGAAGSGVTEVVTAPGASGSGVTEAVVPPVGVAGARGATGLGAAETAGVPLAATGAEEGTGVAVPEAAGVPGNVGVGHEAVPAVLASGESGAAVPPVGVTGAQGAAGVAAAEPAGGPVTAAAQAAVGSGAPGAAASTTSAAETKGAADPAASRAVGAPVAAAGAPGAGAAVSGAVGVPGTGAAASGAVGVPGAGAAVSGVVGAPGAGSAVKVGVPGAGGDVKERAGGVRPGGAGMPADVGRGRVGPPPPPPGQWAPGGPGGPGGAGGSPIRPTGGRRSGSRSWGPVAG